MCGISGCIDLKGKILEEIITAMNNSLKHRGPDDSGIYISGNRKIALAHKRLSFLDLSELGRQPMKDNSEEIIISLNGEIYNYLELKEELKGNYSFKTNTDTEVVLAGYAKWGIEVVNKLEGMFAFALLDLKKEKLFLVRDRFGIKPLYYHISNKQLVFASELKAIAEHPVFSKEIDYSSFCDYFVYRYIPSPKTIWKNTYKVPPAYYLEFDTNNLSVKNVEYWKPCFSDKKISSADFIAQTDELLLNSVKQHLRADVPIGSFLSGGYDSSALVYYMSRAGYKPETFSIGFKNWEESEHNYAKVVADKFNVNLNVELADDNNFELLDEMPVVYDEPLADISIIPTYMVSILARKKVKTVFSGEGADEIFGGYTWQKNFFALKNIHSIKEKINRWFKPLDTVEYYANSMAMGVFGKEELKKLLQPEYYQCIPDDLNWFFKKNFKKNLSPLKSIQYLDMKCFMGEMVLTKMDRASMFHSLEVRVPFLNHKLYETIFAHDESSYFKPGVTKYLLHENLKKHLPEKILNREKQGFVGPAEYYTNMEWYRKILSKSKLVQAGITNENFISEKLKANDYWILWKLAVMEKWFEKWGS
ncbi:MAG: Asparagine synthetase [glutamine-hydrolyzing] 1 [Bacteroidia bacterium]|nr:Asparagine synthetase [glutamine-hydrolyzing] 1 [Bacteroidia bacterium]